jgi:hypothetical protein
MTDPMDALAADLNDMVDQQERRIRAVPPAKATPAVQATNEDTGRASRSMLDQMNNIVTGLEKELADTDAVRLNVLHRMQDLKLALDASKMAVETLKVRGSLK